MATRPTLNIGTSKHKANPAPAPIRGECSRNERKTMMIYYYYTSRSFHDQVMIVERTEEIEQLDAYIGAKAEFDQAIAALNFLGIPYQIITEDSHNGDVLLLGDENELREA